MELTRRRSLKANKLVELALFANPPLNSSRIRMLIKIAGREVNGRDNAFLKGAIAAEEKVGLKMNVKKTDLKK